MAPHAWRPTPSKRPRTSDFASTQPEYPAAAYIQAYEAQLEYSSSTASGSGEGSSTSSATGRGSLIRWSGGEEGDEEVWADRYNIIHLLPSLPPSMPARRRAASPASSSSSWADLPSDEEELFDISGDEAVEAYEKEKKRRWLERLREERLKEREVEDVKLVARLEENAAKADEVPGAVRALMLHTAKSMYAAPNPKSLEMRILANHATDKRFAFLRNGRWTGEWEKVKRGVRVEMGLEKAEGAVVLLGGYGSDSEEESEDGKGEEEGGKEPASPPPPPPSPPPDEFDMPDPDAVDEVKADVDLEETRRIRRERLGEWKRNKRNGTD